MQALHHASPYHDEQFSRSLVRLGGVFVAVQSALLAASYWFEGSLDGPWRVAINLVSCMVGVLTWWLERRGQWRQGTYVLVWGLWMVVGMVALASGGLRSNNHLGLPIILLFCGWVLGSRATWCLLAASMAMVLVFKAVEVSGWMPQYIWPTTWSYLLYTCSTLVLTAAVTLKARAHFMARAQVAEAAMEKARASEQELRKFSLAVEQCPASIVITDTQACVVYANQAFLQTSGYTLDEVLGRHTREVSTNGMDDVLRHKAMQQLLKGHVWHGDLRNHRKDGQVVLEDVRIAPLRNGEGVPTHYVELKQDITERAKAEATIHQLAHFDRITGLPNRFAFLKRLKELKEQSRGKRCHISPCPRHGLLVLDVDRFTSFNDVQGSVQGDHLLRAVAECLGALVPSSGAVVRNSADEFAIVLEHLAVDIEDAELLTKAFAQRAMDALSADPLLLDGMQDGVRVT